MLLIVRHSPVSIIVSWSRPIIFIPGTILFGFSIFVLGVLLFGHYRALALSPADIKRWPYITSRSRRGDSGSLVGKRAPVYSTEAQL
jgi:hypothetical protein